MSIVGIRAAGVDVEVEFSVRSPVWAGVEAVVVSCKRRCSDEVAGGVVTPMSEPVVDALVSGEPVVWNERPSCGRDSSILGGPGAVVFCEDGSAVLGPSA